MWVPGRRFVRAVGATGAAGFVLCAAASAVTPTAPTLTLERAPVLPSATLTVTPRGDGVVRIDPGGRACPPTCSVELAAGTMVTLTATPDGERAVVLFGSPCDDASGGVCTFSLAADTALTVTFAVPTSGTLPPPATEPEPEPEPPPPPPTGEEPPPPPPGGGGTPDPEDPFARVDAFLESLPLGNVAFNAPDRLEQGETAVIQLLVSPDLGRRLEAEITEPGERETATIKVSRKMEARLTGRGFAIELVSADEVQQLAGSEPTEWRWEIQAREAGTHRLHLTLAVLVELDGSETPRTIETFAKEIAIEVPWTSRVSGFLGDNWQWLWGAILLPLVGWLLRRRRRETAGARG